MSENFKNTSILTEEKKDIENNLLEGSISKAIFIVAGPTMIHMFLETSYHLIDAIWIGMLGSVALAATAASSFILWLVFSACALTEVGVNSLVAKYTGAKEPESVNKVARNGFLFGIFLAFFISLFFILFCEKIFYLMGLESDVISNAICFILPIFVGLPIFTSTTISSAVFRGIGDTKTPLKILSTSLILNAILAPLFIFGIFFPQMGIAGGALATILCQTFAALVSIYLLKKRNIVNNSHFLEFKSFKDIFKIGSPIAVNGVIFCVVYLFLSRVISPFGTGAIAALGIGHRIESISYCISLGFSIAATTLVGQNIGAKNNKRAIDIIWKTLIYVGSVIASISVLILLFREQIAMLFSSDPDVIKNAVLYLIAIGTTEVFLGFEVVMEGVFSGLGNTLPPTIIGLPINILRVPIAYYSSKYFGISGIWWTIGLTTVLKGLILVIWFKKLSKSSIYLK